MGKIPSIARSKPIITRIPRRAKRETIRKAASALFTARAYVARALFYVALVMTGVMLLILYFAKAETGVTIAIPLVVLALFLVLALGFRLSFASLRIIK